MLSRLTALSTISVVALAACATNQESPYYKHSTKYQGAPVTSVAQVPSTVQAAPVSYEASTYDPAVNYQNTQQASYTRVSHECLKKEKNHELLGAGIGGTIGAIAGKQLIGGTKGTVIGAGLGGAAGYGIGDKSVNCDPQTFVMQQEQAVVSAPYAAPTQPIITHPVMTQSVSTAATTVSASPTDTEFNTISETGTPGYQVLQAQTVQPYEAPPAISSQDQAYGTAQEISYDYAANTVAASAATNAIPSEIRIMGGISAYSSHIVKDGDTVYSLARQNCVGITEIQSLNNLNASYGINIGDQLQLPAPRC